MRGSHLEQIDWLSKFSGVDLRKELKSWKIFVEITQRRNLFVHTGGKISQQYLDECKKCGCDISKLAKGEQLYVSAKYFVKAYENILEAGLIIAQAIWRKLLPDQRKAADQNLNNICIELISEDRCSLACKILDHAIYEFKYHHSSEQYRLMMLVNLAQAYLWRGEKEKAKKILEGQDWSAKSNEFKLAVAVLSEDFAEAYRLMRIIGTTGTPSEEEYKDWPLFRQICKEQQFTEVYEEIFKIPFRTSEPTTPADKSLFGNVGSQSLLAMFEKLEDAES